MPTEKIRFSAADIAKALGDYAPTEEQTAVIEAPLDKPLVVVAGAGSGKTTTMSMRVLYLVANQLVAPEKVLGLTFTRKAASGLRLSMTSKLQALAASGLLEDLPGDLLETLAQGSSQPMVSTYDSFAGNLLREHGLRGGIPTDYALISEGSRWQMAHDIVNSWPSQTVFGDARYSTFERLGANKPSTIVDKVLGLNAEIRGHLLTVEELEAELTRLQASVGEYLQFLEDHGGKRGKDKVPLATKEKEKTKKTLESISKRLALLPMVQAFQDAKQDDNVMDFADQTALAVKLVEKVPVVGEILRQDFSVVLLDEFQDTSMAQLRLLSELFRDHPVTAVGDPNQAIYGWRGAASQTLGAFRTFFATQKGSDVVQLTMSTSWRNAEGVLSVSNEIAKHLDVGVLGTSGESIIQGPVLSARPDASEGQVLYAYCDTDQEQAQAIAAHMKKLFNAHEGSGMAPQGYAVLSRARSLMPVLAQALKDQGLPVSVVGGESYLEDPGVSRIRAALSVLADPGRGDAMMQLLNSLNLGITDIQVLHEVSRLLARRLDSENSPEDTVAQSLRFPPQLPLSLALEVFPGGIHAAHDQDTYGLSKLSAEGYRRVFALAKQMRVLRLHRHLPVAGLIAFAARLFAQDIEAQIEGSNTSRNTLNSFIAQATQYEKGNVVASLEAFLGWLEIAEEKENSFGSVQVEEEPGVVQIMTIHAAKGLEWNHVVVAGLSNSRFPSYNGQKKCEPSDLDEYGWLNADAHVPYTIRGDAPYLPQLELSTTRLDIAGELSAVHGYTKILGATRIEEERRLAYVGFTRAKDTLLLAHSWYYGTTVNKREPSIFLTEALSTGVVEPLEIDGHAYEASDPPEKNPNTDRESIALWPAPHRALEDSAFAESVSAVQHVLQDALGNDGEDLDWEGLEARAEKLGAPYVHLVSDLEAIVRARNEKPAKAVEALVGQISASNVVSASENFEKFKRYKLRPVPQEPSHVARLGTLFHSWIQDYLQGEQGLLGIGLAGMDDAPLVSEGQASRLEKWKQTVIDLLEREKWQVVEVEKDYTLSVSSDEGEEATTIRAKIDAVFVDQGRYRIVDWKTGKIPTEVELDSHLHQLGIYRLAWKAAHPNVPLEDIEAQLVYVAHEATTITLSEIMGPGTQYDIDYLQGILAELKV
ncbi:MAG: ATP-dependent DNA helicase [Actinomycetaceae bacterium]|nr:ATP-dependent DNA helicase [Actinomycetaceae bacterium]